MLPPNPTPNLVPDFDVTVHIVLDDFGAAGRVYRETDEAGAGCADVIDDLLTGQFNNPPRHRLQHRGRMVAGCVGRHSVGIDATGDRGSEAAHCADAREFHIGDDELLHAEAGLV
jgi:hypothetical protein